MDFTCFIVKVVLSLHPEEGVLQLTYSRAKISGIHGNIQSFAFSWQLWTYIGHVCPMGIKFCFFLRFKLSASYIIIEYNARGTRTSMCTGLVELIPYPSLLVMMGEICSHCLRLFNQYVHSGHLILGKISVISKQWRMLAMNPNQKSSTRRWRRD